MTLKINLIAFFLSTSLLGIAQTGKIMGYLNLQDLENRNTVIGNTFIIIKSKTLSDSIKVAKNLSFKFENLPADSFELSVSPPSHPYNNRYIVNLSIGETQNLNIPYSSICPYEKTKDGICPICNKRDKVIPIRYGLIAEKIDKTKSQKRKYKSGGCLIMDCHPSWFCERDQKDF